MNHRSVLAVSALALIAALCTVSQTGAQVKQGKTRPLTTKQMMAGLVKPNCAAIAEAMKESGPADDKAWEAVAQNAALLNESAHLMMQDGRCPDAVWAGACKALQDSSQALLAKAQAKDAAGVRDAFTGVTGSCKSCHTAHKK